jgi:hypothetical protein
LLLTETDQGMSKGIRDLKAKDILLGIIAPTLVCLLIIWFPLNERTLASINPAFQGIFVFGVQEVIMIVAIPMLTGLIWNKWAGGASGFLLGSIYALWYGLYGAMSPMWIHNIGLLGYLLSAMLIGYMAGALNQNSRKLSRLLFSGLTAALVGGLFLFFTEQLATPVLVYGEYGFFVTMTPRLVFGIVTPLIARLVLRHQTSVLEKTSETVEHLKATQH